MHNAPNARYEPPHFFFSLGKKEGDLNGRVAHEVVYHEPHHQSPRASLPLSKVSSRPTIGFRLNMKICIGHATIDFVDLLYNKEKDKFLII